MIADVSWKDLSEAYAFVGNSLLKPMTQTSDIGLDSAFWEAFPTFGSSEVAGVCAALAAYARAAREAAASDGCDPVERCAVEYTRLFVGPPRPAAAPWETMHRAGGSAAVGGATVGFGQATFEMRALLREAGLEVKNENNLSALCARAAEGEEGAVEEVRTFAEDRLLAWLPFLRAAAEEAAPDGYLPLLLALADALLRVPSGASA